MGQHVFTLSEAHALQGHQLLATQDFRDEFDRLLIPATSVCRVIGIDAWEEDDGERLAIVAIQYAQEGAVPKLVLVNKTTYQEHFTDMSPLPEETEEIHQPYLVLLSSSTKNKP